MPSDPCRTPTGAAVAEERTPPRPLCRCHPPSADGDHREAGIAPTESRAAEAAPPLPLRSRLPQAAPARVIGAGHPARPAIGHATRWPDECTTVRKKHRQHNPMRGTLIPRLPPRRPKDDMDRERLRNTQPGAHGPQLQGLRRVGVDRGPQLPDVQRARQLRAPVLVPAETSRWADLGLPIAECNEWFFVSARSDVICHRPLPTIDPATVPCGACKGSRWFRMTTSDGLQNPIWCYACGGYGTAALPPEAPRFTWF